MSALEKSPTAGVHLPPALAGTGISVVEKNGVRGVNLPPELFQRFNVVSPTTQIAAMDPMWSPSIALIHLDPNTHGYPGEKQGETALAKAGILALADGAGIRIDTARMPRNVLADDEIGWSATAWVRQPDGQLKPITQSKVISKSDERELIEVQSWASEQKYGKPPDRQKAADKAATRWLKERQHLDRKAESKAMLAAIRAAMQLRHALPTAEFSRPWIVVRVMFTLDYSDPQIRQQAISRGLGAGADLYGAPATPMAALPAGAYADDPPSDDAPEFVPDAHVIDEQTATPATAPTEDPDAAYAEWQAQQDQTSEAADPGATNSWQAIADAAGPTTINFGKHSGLCIAEVYAKDGSYLDWLISAQYQPKNDGAERIKTHSRDYLQAAIQLGLPRGAGEAKS